MDRLLNIDSIKGYVDRCCKTEEECGNCTTKTKCLIGFSQIALEYVQQKTAFNIPNGSKLIPKDDMRIYYQDDLRRALLEVMLQCQICEDSHDDHCIINVVRLSLETALFGDTLPYHGSSFSYLMFLARQHPDIGNQMLAEFKQAKNLA